jgi:hypothetical protein
MVLIFIPISDNCPVVSTWKMFKKYRIENKLFVSERNKYLKEYLNELKISEIELGKTFVFAHGKEDGAGLLFFDNNILDSDWWNSTSKFNVAVFHTCFGANVLRSYFFNSLYNDWLSYEDELYVLQGENGIIQNISNFWGSIYLKMAEALRQHDSSIKLKSVFREIYINSLLELEKLPFGDYKQLTKSHIVQALESMSTK